MQREVDVAVVGGGLGGLTLAISLLDASVPVAVFEQAGELREIGAGVAIGANGTRLLDRLGVELSDVANVPPTLQVRRWHDGELIWSHPIGDWYRRRMGAACLMLHRGTLHRMLAARVPPERLHLNHRLTGLVDEPGGSGCSSPSSPTCWPGSSWGWTACARRPAVTSPRTSRRCTRVRSAFAG